MKHWLITLSFLLLAFCAGCGTKNKVDLPDHPIVILFENEWGIEWAKDKNKGLVLNDVKQ